MLGLMLLAWAGCAGPENTTPASDATSNETPSVEAGTVARQSPPDPDSSSELPDGALRVAFLGTSLTAGLGLVRGELGYPERVATLAEAAGTPIEVINAGVSGDTSAGGLRRLHRVLDQPINVLVVELGANDALRGQPPEALADNLREIVRTTREDQPEARIILAGMEAPTNLGLTYVDAFRAVYSTVANELDVTLIPFLLTGVAGVPSLNQSDRIHPTEQGHEVIARDVVWPVLSAVIESMDTGGES
jgi:acyl-CoA thioesterase-1